MKRALFADEEPKTPSPPTEKVSKQTKQYAAEVAITLQQQGMTIEEIAFVLCQPTYQPGTRALQGHVSAIKGGGTPFKDTNNAGRPQKLLQEDWEVVAGWILSHENALELSDVVAWIKANFKGSIDESTVSRHKDDLHLSYQLFGSRPMPKGCTRDSYILGYFEFVKMLHDEDFFNFSPDKIICIDSVTNSQRVERQKGMNIIGGKQRKLAKDAPTYTNNYVIGVTLSGKVLYVLMFTYDPAFDPNGERWPEVVEWCKNEKIKPEHIFYTESRKQYCKEQAQHYSDFKRVNKKALTHAKILHDAGTSFKIDGELLFDDKTESVTIFPPAQHGELSVLDNKLNAVAKKLWKKERTNTDHSYDALILLSCLQRTERADIVSWWNQNFLLQTRNLTVRAVEDQLKKVGNRVPMRQALADMYVNAYEEWLQEHDEVVPVIEIPLEDDGLDGSYWSKRK